MNAQEAKAAMYEMGQLEVTATEYSRDVRDALLDYKVRMKDVGDQAREDHTEKELKRLDKKFNIS